MATEHPIGTRKHKLSTAKNPCPKKAPPTDIANPTKVRQNTEAIFKIALKKFSHQETNLKLNHTVKNDKKQVKEKKEARTSTSERSRLVFDGISKETPKEGEDKKEDEDSQRSLEFADDIESDSIITGGAAAQGPSEEVEEEYETDPERQDKLQAIANRLGEIGDEFQNRNQVDANFQQELLTCAVSITSEGLYQAFETTIETFLQNRHQNMQDPGDQYKVALVLLCTQKAISLAAKPVEAASTEADRLINYAVTFVTNRFPSWLGGLV